MFARKSTRLTCKCVKVTIKPELIVFTANFLTHLTHCFTVSIVKLLMLLLSPKMPGRLDEHTSFANTIVQCI